MCIIILDEKDIYPDGIAITHTSLNRARATVGSVSDGVRIHRAQKLAPDRARFWFRQRFVNTSRLFISNHNYAALNKQPPGSFLTVLLDLTSKDRAKFPVAFQKESCHPSCRKPKGFVPP